MDPPPPVDDDDGDDVSPACRHRSRAPPARTESLLLRIILGDDAELITRFPEQTGKVTVLSLDGDKVTTIRFWTPESEPIDSVLK